MCHNWSMPHLTIGQYILAGLVATVGLASVIVSGLTGDQADMRIEPSWGIATVSETVTVVVIVEASVPVNVFGGEVKFDSNFLTVESIDYNTSIADLWAEKPWYENGAGTIHFVGGTTQKGGFVGKDKLITINFRTEKTGETKLGVSSAKIMQHDGLGTEAALAEPVDVIYEITSDTDKVRTVTSKDLAGPTFRVLPTLPNTDLNGDGRQSVIDISIFMTDLATQNKRSDFNADGKVGTTDLNILLSN